MEKQLRHDEETLTVDSLSSTPFASAPCSPGRRSSSSSGYATATSADAVSAFFFSAPASPTHFLLSSAPAMSAVNSGGGVDLGDTNFEFGLSARGAMSTADELFINGQIRSGFASPERDLDQMARNGSVHRRTRSVSPTRSPRFNWRERRNQASKSPNPDSNPKSDQTEPDRSVSTSASTSRSSSSSSTSSNPSNRNSKRWTFIKDLFLHRSKSEGNQNRNRPTTTTTIEPRNPRSRNYKKTNKSAINGSFSPVMYKERAVPSGQVEEIRRRTTFLPYRPGLLFGCLGFRRYSAINGFARNISSVSSSR
ncbi:hypothetical protein LUZ60_003498 [Juncus effusus]|nr:hypothetical protein LUZ60_003498 [Juncus effusus]